MKFISTKAEFDCKLYNKKPKWYCIASRPRTGSTLLAEFLDRSGQAGVPLEYFNSLYIDDFVERCGQFSSKKDYILFLEHYRSTPNGIFGVKAHWDQFSSFIEYVPADCVFINLYRENIFRQTVSFFKAFNTGNWSKTENENDTLGAKSYDFVLMFKYLYYLISINNSWVDFFNKYKKIFITISYEELNKNRVEVLKQIEDLINIDLSSSYNISPKLKVQSNNLSEFLYKKFIGDIKKFKIQVEYDKINSMYNIHSPSLKF